jgi:uncharacterized membrane protein
MKGLPLFGPLASRFELHERYRCWLGLLMAMGCLAIAALAQWRLDRQQVGLFAVVAFLSAGVAFALFCGTLALERAAISPESAPRGAPAVMQVMSPAAAPLALALLGCLNFGDNRFRPLGFLLWAGGLLSALGYLVLVEGDKSVPKRMAAWLDGRRLHISRVHLVLLFVTAVGAALRLYALNAIPADIGWDLPYNYTDTLSILRGEYQIFFPANQGREGLFFYLSALVARFSPLSHFSLKLTSALVGIATMPTLYAAAKELFSPQVGLMAAGLLAVNRWHMILSRSGFRVSLLPLFVILLLWAVARVLRSRRMTDAALAGVVLGLGLYTYTAFAFTAVAIPLGLAVLYLGGRRVHWTLILTLLVVGATFALVVYAPLGRFALENPDQYLRRVGLQIRLIGADSQRQAMTLPLLLENVRTSLLMYNAYGDSNVRFNVPGERQFGFVSGVLLVLGVCYVLRRWRHGYNGILLAMFFVLIVPMTLAMFPHEMPNIFRAAGTIGPGLILAALPLAVVVQRLGALSAHYPAHDVRVRLGISGVHGAYEFVVTLGRRAIVAALPVLLAAAFLCVEFREVRQFYFHDFVAVLPDKQNVSIAREMARQMEAYGDLSLCYIKVWPHWFDGRALQTYLRRQYGSWNPEFTEIRQDQPPLSTLTERGMIILHPSDQAGLETLQGAFPHHATVTQRLPDGSPAFVIVYVER